MEIVNRTQQPRNVWVRVRTTVTNFELERRGWFMPITDLSLSLVVHWMERNAAVACTQ